MDEENYQELLGFADYLGIDYHKYPELLWIAEDCSAAPLPAGWVEHEDDDGNRFFYHNASETSQWDHPLDQYFKEMYRKEKKKIKKKKAFQAMMRLEENKVEWSKHPEMVAAAASVIAATWRAHAQRNMYKRQRGAAILIQARWRGYAARKAYEARRHHVIRIQAAWRAHAATRDYRAIRQATVVLQNAARGLRAKKDLRDLQCERAAIVLQRFWRQYRVHLQRRRESLAALIIQRNYRRHVAWRDYIQRMWGMKRGYSLVGETDGVDCVKQESSLVGNSDSTRRRVERPRLRVEVDGGCSSPNLSDSSAYCTPPRTIIRDPEHQHPGHRPVLKGHVHSADTTPSRMQRVPHRHPALPPQSQQAVIPSPGVRSVTKTRYRAEKGLAFTLSPSASLSPNGNRLSANKSRRSPRQARELPHMLSTQGRETAVQRGILKSTHAHSGERSRRHQARPSPSDRHHNLYDKYSHHHAPHRREKNTRVVHAWNAPALQRNRISHPLAAKETIQFRSSPVRPRGANSAAHRVGGSLARPSPRKPRGAPSSRYPSVGPTAAASGLRSFHEVSELIRQGLVPPQPTLHLPPPRWDDFCRHRRAPRVSDTDAGTHISNTSSEKAGPLVLPEIRSLSISPSQAPSAVREESISLPELSRADHQMNNAVAVEEHSTHAVLSTSSPQYGRPAAYGYPVIPASSNAQQLMVPSPPPGFGHYPNMVQVVYFTP